MKFKFEKLQIWQIAMNYGEDIFKLSVYFPKEEMYNLTSQLRRANDSIALNIAEGSIGQSNPEYKRFVGFSIRSFAEVITCLYKARNREYISIEIFNRYYEESYKLMNMMIAFRNKLK